MGINFLKTYTKLNCLLADVPTADKVGILAASLIHILNSQANNTTKRAVLELLVKEVK